MHFECELSPFMIQTLIWSHPCTYQNKKNRIHKTVINKYRNDRLLQNTTCCNRGDGFLLACENLGRMFDNSFPTFALFFSRWRLGRAH